MTEATTNPTYAAQDNTAAEGSAETERQEANAEQAGNEDLNSGGNMSGEEEQPGAPENYEPFDLPEGVTLSDEKFAEISEFAKSLDLNQGQAQQAIDYHNKVITGMNERTIEQVEQNLADTRKEWMRQVKTDGEIGGTRMDAKIEKAMKVLNAFSDKATDAAGKPIMGENGEALTKISVALNESRFGDHPEMIRIFSRIGDLIGEDRYLSGKAPAGAPKTQADAMYPDHVEGART